MTARLALGPFMLILLAGCGETGEPQSPDDGHRRAPITDAKSTKGPIMTAGQRRPTNPADREGAKVYRPKPLANIRRDTYSSPVVDLDTGDKLIVRNGHAGGVGTFGFSNAAVGLIASGGYRYWGATDRSVFEVTWIRTTVDGVHQYRAREEYDISRIAEMFRALSDEAVRKARPIVGNIPLRDVLVVDSRPEKISEINPVNGQLKSVK